MITHYDDINNYINNKFNNFFHGNCLLQDKNEWNDYADFLETLDIQYGLEIGSYNGGTFFTLCQIASEDATLINIDIAYGEYCGFTIRNKVFSLFAIDNQKVINLNNDSNDDKTVGLVYDILGLNKLDYLFIDANHDLEHANNDYNKYKIFVKDGGIIAFHDINDLDCTGPYTLWRELKNNFKNKEFSYCESKAGIGILYNNIPIET